MTLARLHPDDLTALANHVAVRMIELLRENAGGRAFQPPSQAGGLITAAEVALHFGVSRGWVYANADHLGAVRLGSGPKPRLRFESAQVAERMRARSVGEESRRARPPASAGVRSVAGLGLAPIDFEVLPERWRRAVGCGPTTESGAAPRQRPAPGTGGSSSGAARTLPTTGRRASSARRSSSGALTEGSRHGDDE